MYGTSKSLLINYLRVPYSLEYNVALYSYNADRNSHYTRGRIIFKVALYPLPISIPLNFNRFLTVSKGFLSGIRTILVKHVLGVVLLSYGQCPWVKNFLIWNSRPKYLALYKRSHYILRSHYINILRQFPRIIFEVVLY